jgi:hypothetical protein
VEKTVCQKIIMAILEGSKDGNPSYITRINRLFRRTVS